MAKIFFLFIYVVSLLTTIEANEKITLSWLKDKPRTIAKDFYIWRYLNQDITSDEAIEALGGARYVNNKLFFRYAKKLKDKSTSKVVSCIKANPLKLVSQDSDCIEVGMTTFKATKLSSKNLQIIINKLKPKYPKSAQVFEILKSNEPFKKLITTNNDTFFNTFNECGGNFRVKYLNHTLPQQTINHLLKDKQFEQTIKKIVTNLKLDKLQQSLFNIDTTNLSHKATFNLAINAIRYNKIKIALKYLKSSYIKSYFKADQDKVLFWQYKLTNNSKYLDQLASSWDTNIYSLFAFDKKGIKPKNIIYNIPQTTTSSSTYNIKDPFSWIKVLNDTRKIDKTKFLKYKSLFSTEQTKPQLAFVEERFYRYKKAFFITPYKNIVKSYTPKRKALIYAIARQESRFIPTSISSAYAMGVMQIMPFLSKALAKQLKEDYDIDKQLNPTTNITYANTHLNFLERRLKNPLFIAYGYNGGIGFTKRILKSGLFKQNKQFEPFLSMELVPYDETKKYGKRVLANYFIYYNYLNKTKMSYSQLINIKQ